MRMCSCASDYINYCVHCVPAQTNLTLGLCVDEFLLQSMHGRLVHLLLLSHHLLFLYNRHRHDEENAEGKDKKRGHNLLQLCGSLRPSPSAPPLSIPPTLSCSVK